MQSERDEIASYDSYLALKEEDETEDRREKWEHCSSIYNYFLKFFFNQRNEQEDLYNQHAFDRLGKLLYSFLPDTFDDVAFEKYIERNKQKRHYLNNECNTLIKEKMKEFKPKKRSPSYKLKRTLTNQSTPF